VKARGGTFAHNMLGRAKGDPARAEAIRAEPGRAIDGALSCMRRLASRRIIF